MVLFVFWEGEFVASLEGDDVDFVGSDEGGVVEFK